MKKLIKPVVLLIAVTAAIVMPTILFTGADAAAVPAEAAGFSSFSPDLRELYTLRSYGGGVGVFSDNDYSEPIFFAEIDISSLRAVDRDMFETGVTVGSWEDVLRLLEDFMS